MSTSLPPSASTFSFTAPFPPTASSSASSTPASLKQQRRVSLALPSSPRQFPAWSFRDDTSVGVGVSSPPALVPEKKGKIRRIASDNDDVEETMLSASLAGPSFLPTQGSSTSAPGESSKKPRKKWTAEETQMLVDGCNKWGVGNWKTILNDPDLKFDNRSPVDLKDRFRTYFPDAYKHHYPNARTHLSTKTRSTHPDGSPLFCASRSKKRRPFTPEEDAALKAGYDKHGTVWATIVKDPIFQQQNRRSTDLRDRFRNAWPDLYAKAGYKPRAAVVKKKKMDDGDNVEESSRGRVQPVRAATDDQLPTTSAMGGPVRRKRRHTTQGFGLFRGGVKSVPESTATTEDEESDSEDEAEAFQASDAPRHSKAEMSVDVSNQDLSMQDVASSSSLSMSDMTDSSQSQSQSTIASWPELESASNAWSTSRTPNPAYAESLAASPTPSTDYILSHSPAGMASNSMIGKSAWGTQDWLSSNPRLDAGGMSGNGNNSFSGIFSPSPMGSPSTYAAAQSHTLSMAHVSLNQFSLPGAHTQGIGSYSHSHGVMDRYDLFPISQGLDLDLDFVSEGFGDTGDAHSAFSDPSAWVGPSDMRRGGFTHHSNYAGDLIFGARTHQPSGPSRMDYGPGFGFGLGLEDAHPSSVLHTPNLPGIDEIELTNITLNDPHESDQELPVAMSVEDPSQTLSSASPSDMGSTSVTSPALALQDSFPGLALDELVGIPSSDPADEALGQDAVDVTPDTSHHDTPPATPSHGYRMSARASTGTAHHRSISVPPSEHRAFMPPRTGQSQAVSPRAKQKYLMATPTRAAFGALPLPPTSVPLPPDTPALSASPWPYAALADYSTYQVPYLDLQYYHTNDAQMLPNMASTGDSLPLRAQALDLAQTLARTMTPQATNSAKPFCIPPSLMQLVSDSASSVGNAHSRMPSSNHHRGQSVASVSPQDLELRKGNDNKRKRASWDGGPR